MQQQAEQKRSLDWLTARIRSGLDESNLPPQLVKRLVEVARKNSPHLTSQISSSFIRAETRFVSVAESEEAARPFRWLAIVKRDHGEKAFEDIAESIVN